MRKELGSIRKATFGLGGYQDAMIGLSLEFGRDSWGVADFTGAWAMPPSEHAKWTVEEQDAQFAASVRLLAATLAQAKKENVAQLVGVPVELTFDGQKLDSWRVLTEVIV